MQRMGGLDSAFLYFETPTMHMHVGGLMLVDPSEAPQPYSFEDYRAYIEARLPRVPQFRRKLATVPLNLGRPVWVEDADFDLDYHLHRTVVPAPGGDRETAAVAADVLSRQMDRSRPLWEMWILEGRADGLIGVVSKVHHSLIDGVTGANMMAELFDLERDATPAAAAADDWEPERKPSDVELVGRALADWAVRPARIVKLLPGTLMSVGRLANRRGRGGVAGMPAPFRAPRTSFNATITAHRSVAYTHVSLEDLKTIKNAFGVKINDVVMAVCSGALRTYLSARDELPERSLISAVPISVHERSDESSGTTRISIMFASLASDVEDPAERLRQIALTNEGAKEDHELVGANMLQDWAEHAAPNTFSLAARMYSSLRLANRHPVVHNLVISNVPGPPIPLYFNGGRLVELHPLGPVMDGAGLNVTVLSNMDAIGFGFIACRELMPDLWDLADAVPAAVTELLAAAEATKPADAAEASAESAG
ncbi:MAG TPA: wax ester/triacylglycerol synthase family O-acyltransferase [Mycobacteriales bacterium]|nr:wax ester/triacylglycerol synthase family O-acyltransferase [Mycobacteriales bacterium]HWA66609.1 wax ester/triacylglycerol synthase family O-acyltransferase [Mycobacteriales bacterium]